MRILVLSILLISNHLFGQATWTFEPKAEFERYSIYKGMIDNKYSITMYIEESGEPCNNDYGRWVPNKLYGWYMYDRIGKKIPIVGHYCYSDPCESYKMLFVPQDPIDYIFDENCNIKDAKEIFRQERRWAPNHMEWQMNDGVKYLVSLEVIHESTWKTKAYITLKINNIDIETFDLTKQTQNDYIENIDVLGKKRVDDDFHLILSYSHQSNPGSRGYGMCGAGFEKFLSYIKINNNFEIETFEKIQTYSCISFIETEVTFDIDNPELGFQIKN